MCSSTAASAPTDSITPHSSRTCASESSVPIEVRNSLRGQRVGLVGAARRPRPAARCAYRSAGRRPTACRSPRDRRTRPSTSSRSWNATPRSLPTSWKIACTSGRSAAAAHPELKRPGDGVRRGLVGVDGHRRRDRRRAAGLGRRCRGTGRRAPRCGCRTTPAEPDAARRRAGRRSRRCRRPTPGTRSPSRIAADRPNCSGEPCQRRSRCSSAKSRCTVGSAAAGRRSRRSRRRAPARTRAAVRVPANNRRTSDGPTRRRDRRRPRASPSRRTRAAAACRRAARTPRARRSGRRSRCRCRRTGCGARRDTPAVGR